MYLFSRSARLATGNLQDQMAWALTITEKVNQIAELEIGLWTTVFSPALGTLVWTTVCEELSELEAIDAKLMADSTYLSLAEEGARFSSGEAINDSLVQVVYPGAESLAQTSPQYANVIQSVCAPGNVVRGTLLGVEIAQKAEAITGCPVQFGALATGPYGGVMWASTSESVEQLQRAGEAINSDLSFGEAIDRDAGTAYVAVGTTQTIYRRLI